MIVVGVTHRFYGSREWGVGVARILVGKNWSKLLIILLPLRSTLREGEAPMCPLWFKKIFILNHQGRKGHKEED